MKIVFLIMFFLISYTCSAFEKMVFIDELISQGDYHRALSLAKEGEFSYRKDLKGFKFQKKILEIHVKSQDFDSFDLQVEKLIKNYSHFIIYNHDILRSEGMFLIGNYASAYDSLQKSEATPEEKLYFRVYAGIKKGENDCSSEVCREVISIENKIEKAKKAKSESVSLLLGIIPGMGQVYAGQTSSGIATFLLNSFFIGTSLIAFNNHEPAFGLASALVGTTFYASSIYAGYESTRRFNSNEVEKQKSKLKDVSVRLNLVNIIFN